MRLGILSKSEVLANIELRPTFIEEIKVKQLMNKYLNDIRKRTMFDKAQMLPWIQLVFLALDKEFVFLVQMT